MNNIHKNLEIDQEKRSLPWWHKGIECVCNAGNLDSISGLGNPLEKGMATHSSILAWRIPWTEEPSRLQSMGWQRVGQGA